MGNNIEFLAQSIRELNTATQDVNRKADAAMNITRHAGGG
jgi:hypothetical protein